MFDFIRRVIEALLRWIRRILDLLFGERGGGGTIPDDKCCHLARRDRECQWIGSKANFTCPPNYHRTWWYCCEGTQQIACGECGANPSTCWSGPWECSIWWQTGQSC